MGRRTARGHAPAGGTEEALLPNSPLVFPEDHDRYVDLQQKLSAYLAAARAQAFVVRGEFVVGSDSVVWYGLVHWSPNPVRLPANRTLNLPSARSIEILASIRYLHFSIASPSGHASQVN